MPLAIVWKHIRKGTANIGKGKNDPNRPFSAASSFLLGEIIDFYSKVLEFEKINVNLFLQMLFPQPKFPVPAACVHHHRLWSFRDRDYVYLQVINSGRVKEGCVKTVFNPNPHGSSYFQALRSAILAKPSECMNYWAGRIILYDMGRNTAYLIVERCGLCTVQAWCD